MTGHPLSSPTIHVADAHRASWAVLHGLAMLSAQPDHLVVLFGNSTDTERARAAGIQRFRCLQARSNVPSNASRQLREMLASDGPQTHPLAWDERAHRALTRANIITPQIHLPDEIHGAFPEEKLDRTKTRRGWGLDDRTRVLIPANDHPTGTDAMRLAYIAGILSVAGTPTVAIAPSAAHAHDRAARFTWRHGRARWLIVDDRSPLLLRDAADAFWWQRSRSGGGTSTVRMLIRTGVPGTADRTPQSETLASDRVTLCDPEKDLAPISVLGGAPSRTSALPDHVAFVRAVESLSNKKASLAAG